MARPDTREYPAHFNGYISLVTEDDVVEGLRAQHEATLAFLRDLDEVKAGFRYAPTKWTVKEVVGHLIDAERAFSHRAFHFARGHQTALPPFDENSVAVVANYNRRNLREIVEEYDAIRRGTILLFRHLDPRAWARRGVANNNEVSVRALAFVILGHERHHINILRTRYLQIP
jgi:hypothetical protein